MGFGSGGGSTVSNEFKPPAYQQPGWEQYYNNGLGLAGQPYQSSGIPTVAPFNDFQQASQQMLYDRATNGASDLNAGRGAVTSIASGNNANPWQQFLAGTASGAGPENPFMGGAQGIAGGEANPYMVDPEAVIKATADDMTRGAQRGAFAQTDAAANRAGAYGGSGYNEMQAANAGELARGIGSMSANARQAAAAQNAQTWQAQQQNRLAAMGLGSGMFDNAQGRQLQASQIGGQMFNADIGNMLSAAGLSGQLSQDDWQSINGLMHGGDVYGAYQQALQNAGNQEFGQQQMWPYTQNDYLGGVLSRGSGGQGTNSVTGPGANPYWNIAGLLGTVGGAYYGSRP